MITTTQYCKKCGTLLEFDSSLDHAFCGNCGEKNWKENQVSAESEHSEPSTENNSSIPAKKNWVSALLCGLLGDVGAHFFYVGRYVAGALRVLSFLAIQLILVIGYFKSVNLDLYLPLANKIETLSGTIMGTIIIWLIGLVVLGIFTLIDHFKITFGKFRGKNNQAIPKTWVAIPFIVLRFILLGIALLYIIVFAFLYLQLKLGLLYY